MGCTSLQIVRGENHPLAKLTNEQAEQLRKDYLIKENTLKVLAKKYKISYSATRKVVAHISYNSNYNNMKGGKKL